MVCLISIGCVTSYEKNRNLTSFNESNSVFTVTSFASFCSSLCVHVALKTFCHQADPFSITIFTGHFTDFILFNYPLYL